MSSSNSSSLPAPTISPVYTPTVDENGSILLITVVCAILFFCFLCAVYYQCAERFRSSRLLKAVQAVALYASFLTAMTAGALSSATTSRGGLATFYQTVVEAWTKSGGGRNVLLDFTEMDIEILNSSVGRRRVPLRPVKVPVAVRGDLHDIPQVDSVIFQTKEVPPSQLCTTSSSSSSAAVRATISTQLTGQQRAAFAVGSCSATQRISTKHARCEVKNTSCTAGFCAWCGVRNGSLTNNMKTMSSLTCTWNETLVGMCYCVRRGGPSPPAGSQWLLAEPSTSTCRYSCNGLIWVPSSSEQKTNFTISVMSTQDPANEISAVTGGTRTFPISAHQKYGQLAWVLGFVVTSSCFASFLLALLYGEAICCFRYRRRRRIRRTRRRTDTTRTAAGRNGDDTEATAAEIGNGYGTTDNGVQDESYSDSTSASSSSDDENNSPEVRAAQERQRIAKEEFREVQERAQQQQQQLLLKKPRHNRDASAGDDSLKGCCKICFEPSERRIRFLPCKHSACASCVGKIEKRAKDATVLCPFCRVSIVGSESVDEDDARTFAASPRSSHLPSQSSIDGGMDDANAAGSFASAVESIASV